MFKVHEDGSVEMTAGDTGSIDVETVLEDDEWDEDDRAAFTMKNSKGEEILYRIYEMDAVGGTATFSIGFANADTDQLPRGSYYYDIRYVRNPIYNADESRIVDGDDVCTPQESILISISRAQTEV